MTVEIVDVVWSAMENDEFYTPDDLANILSEPTDRIICILQFLTRYGFTKRLTKHELIYTKVADGPSPTTALKILQALVGNTNEGSVKRTESVASEFRRLKLR